MMLKLKYKESWVLYDNIEEVIYKQCREADFFTRSGKFKDGVKPPCSSMSILESYTELDDDGLKVRHTTHGKAILEIQIFRKNHTGFVIYTDSVAYFMADDGGTLETLYPYCPRTMEKQ